MHEDDKMDTWTDATSAHTPHLTIRNCITYKKATSHHSVTKREFITKHDIMNFTNSMIMNQ